MANVFFAFSQNSFKTVQDSIRSQAAVNNVKSKLSSPSSTAALSNFVSSVHVSSFFKEGVNGTIELHGKFKKGWTGGLILDQKIGKSGNKALPFSLTGISPGSTVLINLKKMFWRPGFNELSDEQVKKLNDAESDYAKRNNIADPRTVGLREISINGTPAEKRMALDAFNSAFKEPFFVDAKLGFTKTSFSYTTDSINLVHASDAFITPTFTLSLVKVLGSGFDVTGYIAVSYNYSENYRSADDVTFTIPFGSTSNYYSETMAFGKPEKQNSNNISAEFRKNIFFNKKNSEAANFAISPSINFGIDSKMLGIFLPVYFIRGAGADGKLLDGLQGGIRFGYFTNTEAGKWTSFNKGFISQLIISAPLDFLDIL